MKSLDELTALQVRVLEVLWERGEASTSEVHGVHDEYARNTIGTLLARLEQYGVVASRRVGRERTYRPLVERDDVRRAKARRFVDEVGGGRLSEVLQHALDVSAVSPEEIARARAILDDWEEP